METVLFVLFAYRGTLSRQQVFPGTPNGLRDLAESLERCVEAGFSAAIEKINVVIPTEPQETVEKAPTPAYSETPWTARTTSQPDVAPETIPMFGNPGPDQPLPFHPAHRVG